MDKTCAVVKRLSRADFEKIERPDGEVSFWVTVRNAFFRVLALMREREGLHVAMILVIDPPENMAIVQMPDDFDPPDGQDVEVA